MSSQNQQKYKSLIVFDVDGVLLDNKLGGFKDILLIFDKKKEVQAIDTKYQRKKHLGPWGLEELAKLYQGFFREKLVKTSLNYCQKNLIPGAKNVVATLKQKNCLVGAISSNPQFIMDTLKVILSLDFAIGTVLEFEKEISTGKISRKVDRYQKAKILKEKMRQFDLLSEKVIVVGDSLTDLPMAGIAGLFIAFNAKKEVIAKADVVISKKDLREILPFLLKV